MAQGDCPYVEWDRDQPYVLHFAYYYGSSTSIRDFNFITLTNCNVIWRADDICNYANPQIASNVHVRLSLLQITNISKWQIRVDIADAFQIFNVLQPEEILNIVNQGQIGSNGTSSINFNTSGAKHVLMVGVQWAPQATYASLNTLPAEIDGATIPCNPKQNNIATRAGGTGSGCCYWSELPEFNSTITAQLSQYTFAMYTGFGFLALG